MREIILADLARIPPTKKGFYHKLQEALNPVNTLDPVHGHVFSDKNFILVADYLKSGLTRKTDKLVLIGSTGNGNNVFVYHAIIVDKDDRVIADHNKSAYPNALTRFLPDKYVMGEYMYLYQGRLPRYHKVIDVIDVSELIKDYEIYVSVNIDKD